MNKRHQNAQKNRRNHRAADRKQKGVYRQKQVHVLSTKALKKREKRQKHVLAGPLFTEPVAEPVEADVNMSKPKPKATKKDVDMQ